MDYYSYTNLTQLRNELDQCTDETRREVLENEIEQVEDFLHDWMHDSGQLDF